MSENTARVASQLPSIQRAYLLSRQFDDGFSEGELGPLSNNSGPQIDLENGSTLSFTLVSGQGVEILNVAADVRDEVAQFVDEHNVEEWAMAIRFAFGPVSATSELAKGLGVETLFGEQIRNGKSAIADVLVAGALGDNFSDVRRNRTQLTDLAAASDRSDARAIAGNLQVLHNGASLIVDIGVELALGIGALGASRRGNRNQDGPEFDAYSRGNLRPNYYAGSRSQALNFAKDAYGIPRSASPSLTIRPGTQQGRALRLDNRNAIAYVYQNPSNGRVVLFRQDNPATYDAPNGVGDQSAHFNAGVLENFDFGSLDSSLQTASSIKLPTHFYWE